MSAHIFLSYRRDDRPGFVGRLAEKLVNIFGDMVFRDVDQIRCGEHWRTTIEDELSHAKVVLALIGPGWHQALLDRQDTETDFVRHELNLSKALNIPVIPVLFDHGELGDAKTLADLSWLHDIQAHRILDDQPSRWTNDVATLVERLELIPGIDRIDRSKLISLYEDKRWVGVALVSLLAAAMAALFLFADWFENKTPADCTVKAVNSAVACGDINAGDINVNSSGQ